MIYYIKMIQNKLFGEEEKTLEENEILRYFNLAR
jgi:hypothetical protein